MQREHEQANVKYIWSLLQFAASSFVRKGVFYSKNIQYAYNVYRTEQYVNVCGGEPSRTSMVVFLCKNHKKALL